jgi:long-chain acyl-CoA synthetase
MLDSLGQVLPHAAREFGDRTALVVGNRSFSFRELDQLSDALAASLVRLGVKLGDRVTLYAPNSWEWIVSYYGALKTGAVINPINVMLTPAEVAYITRDCGASALIGSPDKIRPALEAGVAGLTTIAFGDDAVAGATLFNELIAKQQEFEPAPVKPEATSTIGYTSGTTGHPRGAMQSHRAVILNGAMTAQLHAKTPLDTVVTALPCPHVYGNVVFNGAMMYGLKLVLHPRRRRRGPEQHRGPSGDDCSRVCRPCTCTCSFIRTSTGSRWRRSAAARSAARPCRSPKWTRSSGALAAR